MRRRAVVMIAGWAWVAAGEAAASREMAVAALSAVLEDGAEGHWSRPVRIEWLRQKGLSAREAQQMVEARGIRPGLQRQQKLLEQVREEMVLKDGMWGYATTVVIGDEKVQAMAVVGLVGGASGNGDRREVERVVLRLESAWGRQARAEAPGQGRKGRVTLEMPLCEGAVCEDGDFRLSLAGTRLK